MELILKNWDTQSISLRHTATIRNKAAKQKLNYFNVWFCLLFQINNSFDSYEIVNKLGLKTNAFWIFFVETFFIHKKLSAKLLTHKINQYFIFGQHMENVSIHRLGSFIPEELKNDFECFFQREFLSDAEMIHLDEVTLTANQTEFSLNSLHEIYLDHFIIENENRILVGIKFYNEGICYFTRTKLSTKQFCKWLKSAKQNILAQNALNFLKANTYYREENSYYFRVHYEQYLKMETANICHESIKFVV